MAKSSGSTSRQTCTLGSMDEVRRVFAKYDANGDGRISCDELSAALSALGPRTTRVEAERIMSELDKNGDGFVDLDEFADFFCQEQEGGGADVLREAFDLYDMDKNGLISAKELHTVLNKLGEQCSLSDCRRMIGSVDKDGDGNVNFDEFKAMMTRKSSPSRQ